MKGVGFLFQERDRHSFFMFLGKYIIYQFCMNNKNSKIKPQKQKEYGRLPKKKKLQNNKEKSNKTTPIIDEVLLFNGIKDILEKDGIYLLDLKVRAISDNKKVYAVINLSDLNRFENGAEVTPEILKDMGLVKNALDGIKVLGSGKLEKKLTVKANKFSASAFEQIEKLGGKAEVI